MERMQRALIVTMALTVVVLTGLMLGGCPAEEQIDMEQVPPPDATLEEAPEDAEAVTEDESAAEDGEQEEQEETAAPEDDGSGEDSQNQAGEEQQTVKTTLSIKTDAGEMVAELYDEKMPITAGNFILLAESGFYDGLTFHRVERGFVIQGGDPAGDGSGGPGFAIPLENPGTVHHERGVLSMARTTLPDSAGSQFFVCLSDKPNVQRLDDMQGGYAAFGKVVEGMEVADEISVGDTIKSVTVKSESEHADAAREAAKDARIE